MVAEPEATPSTLPLVGWTVAIEVLLLLQVPPLVAFVKVDVALTQADGVPPIAATLGTSFTVNVAVADVEPQLLVTV